MLWVFECITPDGETTTIQMVGRTEDDARYLLSVAKAFKGYTIGALIKTRKIPNR